MFLTLWATPRSTSTAFEWMMRQRGDFRCFHEPFNELFYYGEDRRSQRDAEVAARPGHTYAAVWQDLVAQSTEHNLFLKDFAYSIEHFVDDDMLNRMQHSFLIRDPYKVIQGLANHWPDCSFDEVGLESLARLFDRIAERRGAAPPVMASDDLLADPGATTAAYCAAVGIEFMPEALEWDAGERNEVSWYGEGTGPWHDSLRQSTGIKPQKSNYPPLEDDPRLVDLYQRALPHYEHLLGYKLDIADGGQA